MSRDWISVKDGLPVVKNERSTRVNVLAAWDYSGLVSEMSFVPSDVQYTPPQWMYKDGRQARFGPTHWQPMPTFTPSVHIM